MRDLWNERVADFGEEDDKIFSEFENFGKERRRGPRRKINSELVDKIVDASETRIATNATFDALLKGKNVVRAVIA